MTFDLIALDLDGTALRPDRTNFSIRLQAALAAAHQKGIAVVPITGRQYGMLPPAVRTGAPWEKLCVLCNGGEVRTLPGGQLLEAHYLARGELLALVELAGALDIPVELSAGGVLYLTRESWQVQRRAGDGLRFHLEEILARRGRETDDLRALCSREDLDFDKVNLPWVPEDRRKRLQTALAALPVAFAWSSGQSVEITHAQATKEYGMIRVCALLGVDPVRTMAIGDSGNDISMLRAAGFGVAMGDAPQEVKDAADIVTASNREDGAALAIERYVLEY